ncbi:methyltransferase family protein [Actinobacteria bacterium IMCC26207]|nr:methyltransferase family protein [Actinobacteria bacterium IMCC26207]
MTASGYIHGFGAQEERRLWEQAGILAPVVFAGLPLPLSGSLLEIGCGVGAQLDQVGTRCPQVQLTGIDLSLTNLNAAQGFVPSSAASAARLVQADATALPFRDQSFDTAMTIWMLEHVKDPSAVLQEALRVLRPDGLLLCTEVDNATFRFLPELPAIQGWWDLFCVQQSEGGGDPFVGRKLRGLAQDLGCQEISTQELGIVSTELNPERRSELLAYLEELLMSGAESLLAEQQAAATGAESALSVEGRLAEVRNEFAQAKADPSIGFEYLAVRLTCRPPNYSL